MGHVLRGCIGTSHPVSLVEGLKHYAIRSALHDSRFAPITADEFPKLVCGVSLLVDFESCANFLDWNIGEHGISMKYRDDASNRVYSAIFLPHVMTEHSKVQTECCF